MKDSTFDPDKTVMNMRARREHGELREGDVVLDRYELLERLGSGVMGVVFKCRDKVSHVEYAVKTVPSELARDADAMEEVRENFQLVYNLSHPNIAGVKFLDRDEYGAYFLIMEYAPGENLTQWIKRKWKAGGPEFGEVVKIIKQIASALDYAHGERILHRDVKPANVMVDDQGKVKVLDFGLASKVRNTMTALSINPANASGTPNYLAPEQFKGKYPTPASDQYALGVIAYQMLAGHLPFDSDDFTVLRAAVNSEKPDMIDGVSEAANRCLQKVLAKEPKERYATCTDFAAAMEAAENAPAVPEQAAAPVPSPPSAKKNRRLWWFLAAAAVLVAVAVAVKISYDAGRRAAGRRQADRPKIAVHPMSKKTPPLCEMDKAVYLGDKTTILLPGNKKLEMVKVEAGTFTMGEHGYNDANEREHTVELTRDFYIGRTEVTQAQYKAVMGTNPSQNNGAHLPVENVSWNDAMAFCNKLNESGMAPNGWKFTLPTEAQWEYAARGGKKSKGYKYSGSNNADDVAWYDENSGDKSLLKNDFFAYRDSQKTHPVAQKAANELGLHDMSGNVNEWCLDCYESNYASDPEFLKGNAGAYRVYRGGEAISGGSTSWNCRVSYRGLSDVAPSHHDNGLGFRVALVQVK